MSQDEVISLRDSLQTELNELRSERVDVDTYKKNLLMGSYSVDELEKLVKKSNRLERNITSVDSKLKQVLFHIRKKQFGCRPIEF